MRSRRSMFLVTLLAAFALIAAACGGDGGDGDTTGTGDQTADRSACTYTIATMGALSGDYASVGRPIAHGVEFAVDQANEEGLGPCNIEFISEDSQGDPNQAPPLAQSIVDDETVIFCACPYFSGETLATGQIFGDAGIAISGTGTNETIDEQGFPTWFRGVAPDNIQAEVAGAYIAAQGAKAVAVIHDNQDYSKGLAEGVLRAIGPIAVNDGKAFIINPEEVEYSAVVSQVKAANPDFIFYGGYTPQAGPLAKQLHEAGVDATFMTDDGAKDPTFGDLAGAEAAEGALASCPCVDPLKIETASEFVSAMQAEYGNDEPGTFAADMYDVTRFVFDEVLANLEEETDPAEVRQMVVEAFQNAEGYEGIAKSYSWNDQGEFEGSAADIWIYEWSNQEKNFISLGPAEELLQEAQ